MVRQGGDEGKRRACQLRGICLAWQLEKLSCLGILHAKPTARWAEWGLSFHSVLVLVAEQEGIAPWSGLLSAIGNRRKNWFRLRMQTDLMTFQVGYFSGEKVTILLQMVKFARCDFIHPSIPVSFPITAGLPFTNIKLMYSHPFLQVSVV